jgi:hypothetical protein
MQNLYVTVGLLSPLFKSINTRLLNLIFTGFMAIYGMLLLAPIVLDWMEAL